MTFKITVAMPEYPHVISRLMDEQGFCELQCERCDMTARFAPSVSGDEFERAALAFGMVHQTCTPAWPEVIA